MQKQNSNLGIIMFSAALGAAVAMAGSYLLFSDLQSQIKEHQTNIPPMVIVDFVDMAQKLAESGGEEVASNTDRIGAAVLKLREAGFIVLDAQAVLAAPQAMYLPQEYVEQE